MTELTTMCNCVANLRESPNLAYPPKAPQRAKSARLGPRRSAYLPPGAITTRASAGYKVTADA
jgi:hypothetical protein